MERSDVRERAEELQLAQPAVVLALHRKLSKKLESGRGAVLTPDELSAFADVGAFGKLAEAATKYQEQLCRERNARSRSTRAAPSASIDGMAARTLESSGTMSIDAANEALAQARAICGRPS